MQDPASLYVGGYRSVAYSISTYSAESEMVEEGVQQYTYYGVLSLTSDCYGAIAVIWIDGEEIAKD